MNWIPIAISTGAVLGALSRYYLTLFWLQKRGDQFPYGTLFVNLTGAFVIGLVATVAPAYGVAIALQKFILVGFLGAYTTFSSYLLDTVNLYRNQRPLAGYGYWIGSIMVGFLSVKLGIWLGQALI